jgi:tyrosyl-tRNA synthetase
VETISSSEAFHKALSSLSLAQQRQVGARCIAHVLDLTDGRCTRHAQQVAETSDISPEELESAYRAVHSVYVSTHPRSDLSPMDFKQQVAHFVSEACMICLVPTYEGRTAHHLAEKLANYCRMARICSSTEHGGENPKFGAAEVAIKKEMDAQYKIFNEFLKSA